MPASALAELPAAWRDRAVDLRTYGSDERAAVLWERAAAELEAALRAASDETLTLEEAARVSRYSADHLGRLIRTQKLPNVGRPYAPRVRRGDLPMKSGAPGAGPLPRTQPSRDISRVEIARAVIKRHVGGD